MVWSGAALLATQWHGRRSFSATTGACYNLCYRFAGTSDDAQDLTQEVFIKMYRTLSSYDVERGAFMTWVTTMTRNLLVDHFRKTKQDRVTDSLDAAASEHEDAMPLSDRIEDKGAPPDARVQSRRGAGSGARGAAESCRQSCGKQ